MDSPLSPWSQSPLKDIVTLLSHPLGFRSTHTLFGNTQSLIDQPILNSLNSVPWKVQISCKILAPYFVSLISSFWPWNQFKPTKRVKILQEIWSSSTECYCFMKGYYDPIGKYHTFDPITPPSHQTFPKWIDFLFLKHIVASVEPMRKWSRKTKIVEQVQNEVQSKFKMLVEA